jgi:hypothetical protein
MSNNPNEKRSLLVSLTNKSGGYDTLNTITTINPQIPLSLPLDPPPPSNLQQKLPKKTFSPGGNANKSSNFQNRNLGNLKQRNQKSNLLKMALYS